MRRCPLGWIPRLAFPVDQPRGCIAANSFPPRFPVRSHRHVRKKRVLAERTHHVLIGFHPRARSHAKKSRFRIDSVQIAVFADFHPGDIVPNSPYSIPLAFESGHHHPPVFFAPRPWKHAAQVTYFAPPPSHPPAPHFLT